MGTIGELIRSRRTTGDRSAATSVDYKQAALRKIFQGVVSLGFLSEKRHEFTELELLDIELLRDRLSDIYDRAKGKK